MGFEPFRTFPPTIVTEPSPFNASIPDAKLVKLHELVKAAEVGPVTYEGLQQDRRYGITRDWLNNAKEQWQRFDWKAVEKEINSFPNYKAQIEHDGTIFDVHFLAIFSEAKSAVPALMLHGWPGSFMEFLPILRLLIRKYSPSTLPYHIVVPSLPGYAFSSPPPLDRDFRLEDVAQMIDTLMVQLGFGEGYAVQGGDIGSKVARVLGGVHRRAKAIHLNFGIMPDPGNIAPSEHNELEKDGLVRAREFAPLALSLSTNPLALLAWIGEKFLDWTDEDPTLETIIEAVSLYWLTDCFATSIYPYRQLFTPGNIGAHENPTWHINKPLGFSWFPKEIAPVPRNWIATTGDLVFFRQHQRGGHFAAIEHPEVLLKDFEDFLRQVWSTS
ncbi:alpha/beta-hydrolase [Viridothelium virens]|uniref:Alpha/beta-hydrolase n=1 Tax=Viridothelium virens TaxID=1048519 RepID=A0A6A6H9F1_VIRVR|nr:alpha/beta-hydrolase [Viridothelium virens]